MRIGDATGLEVFPENEASEIYQVANYGMAGRYSPHTDYITGEDHLHNPLENIRGNRIATLMVYVWMYRYVLRIVYQSFKNIAKNKHMFFNLF